MRAASVGVLVIGLVLGACMKRSEKYCGLHPEDVENCRQDTGPQCEIDADCTATSATPVCDDGQGVCVQCIAGQSGRDTACIGDTPVCEDTSCRGCAADDECLSNFCLADGSCASADEVAYVANNGSGIECTQATPCGELVDAEATRRRYIRISGAVSLDDTTRFDRDQRVIHGAGASLIINGGNTMIEIGAAGTSLEIHGLAMTTAAGGDERTVIRAVSPGATLTLDRVTIHDANGSAIEASVDTMVTIRRSIIANNRTDGEAVVELVNGQFDVTNTIIVGNGDPTAPYAVRLLSTGTGVFAFNTVAGNESNGTVGLAISCDNAMVESSIVLGGRISSECNARYTLYDTLPSPSDPSNRNGVPTFLNETTVTSPMFYRLAPASLGIDWANPNATLADDIDGDARPAGDAPDIGADEVL